MVIPIDPPDVNYGTELTRKHRELVMCDKADQCIEDGELALLLQETGECGQIGICPYCEEDASV